mmetsp:Transcript_16001/g.20452  ORF Transcript_16001/g.20452 Transcript_16001/m.20452 type:complete len:222 (+) Transcript_16001:115-780(+)
MISVLMAPSSARKSSSNAFLNRSISALEIPEVFFAPKLRGALVFCTGTKDLAAAGFFTTALGFTGSGDFSATTPLAGSSAFGSEVSAVALLCSLFCNSDIMLPPVGATSAGFSTLESAKFVFFALSISESELPAFGTAGEAGAGGGGGGGGPPPGGGGGPPEGGAGASGALGGVETRLLVGGTGTAGGRVGSGAGGVGGFSIQSRTFSIVATKSLKSSSTN